MLPKILKRSSPNYSSGILCDSLVLRWDAFVVRDTEIGAFDSPISERLLRGVRILNRWDSVDAFVVAEFPVVFQALAGEFGSGGFSCVRLFQLGGA